ncbi:MAG: glutamine amidotransferase [Bifidobacteriaceae bacterium]|jgi:CobQ-like glutamine amidotransferase family enzyme|nr:glutamine amidotransferase [Bifidobacteriaceae bacterium]
MEFKVLQLYSNDMNIYGDCGNILALKRRLTLYNITAKIIEYNQGDAWPKNIDIIMGGGGQDSGQNKIINDLYKISSNLQNLAQNNTPMLMVCGLYQLFGKFFKTKDGETLNGIEIFNIETYGKDKRLIGNVIAKSNQFGTLVGYENHSGQTYLLDNIEPLAELVTLGAGNNEQDKNEGCIYKNCLGTYLHGSFLPKNPTITDWLINQAAKNRGFNLTTINTQKYQYRAKGINYLTGVEYFTKRARQIAKKLKR